MEYFTLFVSNLAERKKILQAEDTTFRCLITEKGNKKMGMELIEQPNVRKSWVWVTGFQANFSLLLAILLFLSQRHKIIVKIPHFPSVCYFSCISSSLSLPFSAFFSHSSLNSLAQCAAAGNGRIGLRGPGRRPPLPGRRLPDCRGFPADPERPAVLGHRDDLKPKR